MDNQESETFTGGTADPRSLQEAYEAAVARRPFTAVLEEYCFGPRGRTVPISPDMRYWLATLRDMTVDELAYELSEEAAIRQRFLMFRALEMFRLFIGPPGHKSRSEELEVAANEVHAMMLELEAALGVRA